MEKTLLKHSAIERLLWKRQPGLIPILSILLSKESFGCLRKWSG